jgi:hypothetical protein
MVHVGDYYGGRGFIPALTPFGGSLSQKRKLDYGFYIRKDFRDLVRPKPIAAGSTVARIDAGRHGS